MIVNRQEQRSASTRARLIKAARALFARDGYAGVGTEQIARRAGVTRGALYHQFPAKEDLFLAAYEEVERELAEAAGALLGAGTSPLHAMREGIRFFLEACRAPDVQRIVLIDGPSVLGWTRWREVASRYGLGLLEGAIAAAVESGEIAPVEAQPLAHLLMGALDEAALLVVRDPESIDAVSATLERLVDGLRVAGASGGPSASR